MLLRFSIDDFKENNRPAFRVKVWERKDLEQFASSRPALANRYKLQLPDLALSVHPAHLQYMLSPSFNSLDYFFETLDSLDAGIRDQLLGFSFFSVINPRFKEAATGNEMLKDLMVDAVDYNSFRARCHELASQGVGAEFLVYAIVCETLAWARDFGDPSKVDAVIGWHRRAIAYCSKQLLTEKHPQRRATFESMIVRSRESIDTAPAQQRTWASYYKNFCESVLPRLRLEDSSGRFVS